MKRILPYMFATLSLAAPAMAQNTANKDKCNAIAEYASNGTWYSEEGPRISFDCEDDGKSVSGAYLPIGNDGTGAHDAHIKVSFNLGSLTPAIVFSKAEATGYGGALILKKTVGKDTGIFSRFTAYDRGLLLGELKFLSKHLDLAAGVKNLNGKTSPFGYVTYNFGEWDDTFTAGFDTKDKLWQNYSAERKRNGIMEIAYFQPKTGDWGLDTYLGRDDLTRGWFSREIDRVIANNDISPKPRSFTPAFSSYLTFGEKAGEIRAEWIGEKLFVNIGVGGRVKIGKMKAGAGLGVEYERNKGDVLWRPNGEVMLTVPVRGFDLLAQYRFRRNEGGLYATISKGF